MSDPQIAKLVGMKTYCSLYDMNPELYQQRPECSIYNKDGYLDINDISVLLSEDTDMYEIKRNLQKAALGECPEENIKCLINSSWSCDSIAMSQQFSIIWLFIVILFVFIVVYVLVMSGFVHRLFQQNFNPDLY